jgi:fucose permease
VWSLGAVIGGVFATWVAEAGVDLRTHLIAAGVVLIVLAGVLSTSLLAHDEHPDDSRKFEHATPAGRSLGRAGFVAAGVFAVTIEVAAVGWAAFRLADDFGSTPAAASVAYVAVTAGMTVGRFAGDSVAHRIGAGRLLHVSTVIAAIGIALATLIDVRGVVIAGFAIAGLGAATMIPKLYDDAARMPGPAGAGLGALTAGVRIAALGVPVVVGLLAESNLSIGTAIAGVALPSAVGFFAVTRRLAT